MTTEVEESRFIRVTFDMSVTFNQDMDFNTDDDNGTIQITGAVFDHEKPIGTFLGYRVPSDVSTWDADCVSEELGHVLGALYSKQDALSRQVANAIYGSFEATGAIGERYDVLYASRMELDPQYRGHQIGLGVVNAFMQRFYTPCSIGAVLPFPLQLTGKFDTTDRQEWVSAFARLRDYWATLGFVEVPGSDVMAYPLDFKRPEPPWQPIKRPATVRERAYKACMQRIERKEQAERRASERKDTRRERA